jgi:hypothetical protein
VSEGAPAAEAPAAELPPEAVRPLLPAEAGTLGGWLGLFRANAKLIYIAMSCVGFLVLLFGGIGLAVLLTREEPTLKGTLTFLAVFGVLVGLPLVGLYFLWRGLKRWVCIFERGIVTFDARKARAYPWDGVKALFEREVDLHLHGGYIGTTHHVRLRFEDGRKITLDHTFAEIAQLASLVRTRVDEFQLADFRDKLNQGQTVSFDGVEVHATGVNNGRELVTWDQIESVAIDTDRAYHVVVRKTGQKSPWLKKLVPRFPNLSAFMHLLREHDVAVL